MDSFEEIISELLEEDRFWIKKSVRINITKEEKKELNKSSRPRPEIDLVAYDSQKNELILIEVKSFLDSTGVKKEDVIQSYDYPEGRYKILTCALYQEILSKRLKQEWLDRGLINQNTSIRFGLIAGNIHKGDEADLKNHADQNNWFFWEPREIENRIKALAEKGYENTSINDILSRISI